MGQRELPEKGEAVNQKCAEFLRLTVDLHLAISEHGNDSPEADAVRHMMDGPWERLNHLEVAIFDKINECLNDLHDQPQEPSKP